MYLLRYMSRKELEMYLSGEVINGRSEQANQNVCFFRENIISDKGLISHSTMSDALSGIVSKEVLVKFYIDDKTYYELREQGRFDYGYERYADPCGSWGNYIYPVEERLDKYDSNLLQLDSISFNPDFTYDDILISASGLTLENMDEYIRYSKMLKGSSPHYFELNDDKLILSFSHLSNTEAFNIFFCDISPHA